jgi:hypothetical protein
MPNCVILKDSLSGGKWPFLHFLHLGSGRFILKIYLWHMTNLKGHKNEQNTCRLWEINILGGQMAYNSSSNSDLKWGLQGANLSK